MFVFDILYSICMCIISINLTDSKYSVSILCADFFTFRWFLVALKKKTDAASDKSNGCNKMMSHFSHFKYLKKNSIFFLFALICYLYGTSIYFYTRIYIKISTENRCVIGPFDYERTLALKLTRRRRRSKKKTMKMLLVLSTFYMRHN